MSTFLQNYGPCILLVDVLLHLFSLYTDLVRRIFVIVDWLTIMAQQMLTRNEKKNAYCQSREKKSIGERMNKSERKRVIEFIENLFVLFFFFFVWSNNWLCVDGRYCVGIIRLSYFKGYFILFAAPKSVNFLCLFI